LKFWKEASNQACEAPVDGLEQKKNKPTVDKADKPQAGAARSAPMG
jgi:hypothetical protein